MSSNPNFCSECGEKLDANVDIKECPKCHTALHEHAKHKLSFPPVVEQLPYKSPGTTALIAFLGGLFALPEIGHMYVGKVRRGIIILIGGLVLYIVMIIPVIMAFSIQGLLSTQSMFSPETTGDISGAWFLVVFLMIIFGIGYIVLFIWQIFHAPENSQRNLTSLSEQQEKNLGKRPTIFDTLLIKIRLWRLHKRTFWRFLFTEQLARECMI